MDALKHYVYGFVFFFCVFYINSMNSTFPEEVRQKRFPRSLQSLNDIFLFLADCFSNQMVSSDASYKILFAVEEIFTNIVKYNATGTMEILLKFSTNGREACIQLIDEDSPYFDPTRRPEPDLTKPIEQKKPGGLGIYLVKELLDGFEYQHDQRTSTTTLRQQLRS